MRSLIISRAIWFGWRNSTRASRRTGQTMGNNKTTRELLKQPYARVLIPDPESGTYTAQIQEFPGCISQGNTPSEAYRNLESVAEGWIRAALESGLEVPAPGITQAYGGKIALRLPKTLHARAAQLAEREGVSLNQFLLDAIAQRVGAGRLFAELAERMEQRWGQVAFSGVISAITAASKFSIAQDAPEAQMPITRTTMSVKLPSLIAPKRAS